MTAASGLRHYDLSSGRIEVELKSNPGRIVVVTTAKEAFILHTKKYIAYLKLYRLQAAAPQN